MTGVLSRAWKYAGDVRVTVAVCFALTANLGLGFLSLRENLEIFTPMSDVGLLEWLATFGAANPFHALWFFVLLGLLGLLALNTLACTTARVLKVLEHGVRGAELAFRLAPHVMHYAVLIILGGYLASYVLATSEPGRAMRPGDTVAVPGGAGSVTFVGFAPEVLAGDRVPGFDGFVTAPNARVEIEERGRTRFDVLNFNAPLDIGGVGVYLNDFSPRRASGGMGMTYIRMTFRHDPSAAIYRFGMAVFALGLCLYLYDRGWRKA